MKTKTFRTLLTITVFSLLLTLLAWTAASCSQAPEDESESQSGQVGQIDPSGDPSGGSAPGDASGDPSGAPGTGDKPQVDLDAIQNEVLSDLQKQLEDIRTMLLGQPAPAPIPYTYTIADGKVTVTGYTGDETTVIVPATIEDCPVVAIGEKAFAGTGVRCVTLPDSVTTIDWFAFWQCTLLTEVHLSGSVTTIGYAAFDGCHSALTLVSPKGSFAARYAASYGLGHQNAA